MIPGTVSGSPCGLSMVWERTYTDEQLAAAVAASTSWRGTLRELGLVATSSGSMRSVRSQVRRLGIDHCHFSGQRRWTEEQLRAAVDAARTWPEVADALGLTGGSAVAALKGHAVRLGLDVEHLVSHAPVTTDEAPDPDITHLSRAGALLAAAWFTLCGREVSWPLEPSRYDLLVSSDQGLRRVQVKTTITRSGRSWQVFLSTARGERRTYDPHEIDDFFIIDGELGYYLIPVAVVGGLHSIHLNAYEEYRVTSAPFGRQARDGRLVSAAGAGDPETQRRR